MIPMANRRNAKWPATGFRASAAWAEVFDLGDAVLVEHLGGREDDERRRTRLEKVIPTQVSNRMRRNWSRAWAGSRRRASSSGEALISSVSWEACQKKR